MRDHGSRATLRVWLTLFATGSIAAAVGAESPSARSLATGFYRVEPDAGVWWVIDPEGRRQLSRGVNVVRYEGDHAPALGYAPYGRATERKYGSHDAWSEAVVVRLRGWGFNTIGSWSDESLYASGLAYTHNLNVARSVPGRPVFPDVFSEEFAATAERVASEQCGPRRDDRALFGYYLDNELQWGEGWHSELGLLALHFAQGAGAPGRAAAVEHLKATYASVDDLNEALGSALADWEALDRLPNLRALGPQIEQAQRAIQASFFGRLVESGAISRESLVEGSKRMAGGDIEVLNRLRGTRFESFEEAFAPRPMSAIAAELQRVESLFSGRVAEQYFRVASQAIRRHDPNHLILGVRFGGMVFEPVARAMNGYVDVASVNEYRVTPGRELRSLHEWSGRPVLLTEFSFKAQDAGVPSDTSASVPLATQADRADAYERYVDALAALPFVIGYHWFQHHDQPATGRFDGENNNFGLVSNDDVPWAPLVERMRAVNARSEAVHGSAFRPLFNGRDLAGWDRYLGVPEVPALPFDPFGSWPAPIGRNQDPKGVYSVVEEDGEPAIRISGEIWGALISQQEFEDYELRLEYKWGDERHPPDSDAARNTGLLYHSVGPDGAFWSYWMRSGEFEIMPGRTGDFTSVDGVEGSTASMWDRSAGYPWLRYADAETVGADATAVGGLAFRIAASENREQPAGEWNQLDLIVRGGSAEHRVNGEKVFAIEDLAHDVDGERVPLIRGALQLQSEGAEVFFRRIEWRPLGSSGSDVAD